MDLLELSKIMLKTTTGREWSDEEVLDMMKEARDKYEKNSKQWNKMNDFIKNKELIKI